MREAQIKMIHTKIKTCSGGLLLLGILLSGWSSEPNSVVPFYFEAHCCGMIYTVVDEDVAMESSKYYHNIRVLCVSGGNATKCRDESLLQDVQLRCALIDSLKTGEYYSSADYATYSLEVKQESIETLSEGTVQQARVILRGILRNERTNAVIFNERFGSTYLSAYKDGFLPGSRVRVAIEEATQDCIKQMIEKLTIT